MPRKGKRIRVAENVFDDASGRAIIYRDPVTKKQKELRADHGTPISAMRQRVEDALAQRGSGAPAPKGSLGEAVNRLEAIEQRIPGWVERRSELRAWCRATIDGRPLGDHSLAAIDEQTIRTVVNDWTGRVAPKTIRQRLWTLKHLFKVLHGAKAPTPADDIKPPSKVRRVPTFIDPQHVIDVYANLRAMEERGILRDGKTRARFMVRASTGRRPAEIMRAQPADVQIARREWRVRDAKGGWSEGVYLNAEMIAAWQAFADANAWGYFNTGAFMNTIRSAGWNPNDDPYTRAYELRHNVGIALSDAGIDLADISGALGHKNLETTRRTYVPIRNARMQRASEAIDGRFHGWTVPAAVPATRVPHIGNARKSVGKPAPATMGLKKRNAQGKKGRKRGGSA
jgi:integrase